MAKCGRLTDKGKFRSKETRQQAIIGVLAGNEVGLTSLLAMVVGEQLYSKVDWDGSR